MRCSGSAKLSLANRALIALITVFASVFGVITMSSLKQELIPSIEFPQITVITSMPGASPEVVDKQISAPLETALKGVEGRRRRRPPPATGFPRSALAFTYGSTLEQREEPDRPGHLQRQAVAAGRRPAPGHRGQHQRFPDRVPRRLLRQAPQRAERRSRPAHRPAAAEARRRPRRRSDRRRHPSTSRSSPGPRPWLPPAPASSPSARR